MCLTKCKNFYLSFGHIFYPDPEVTPTVSSAYRWTVRFAACFHILAILTVIPLISVMMYNYNNFTGLNGNWTTELIQELDRLNAVGKELNKSWSAEPFVSVLALDSETYPTGCPITHEELIYDIWPGTTMMCDCPEEIFEDAEIFLDTQCLNRGKTDPHWDTCVDIVS